MQFDRLCSLVLRADAGLSDLHWRGRSDRGRVALIDQEFLLRPAADRFRGPATVAVVWVREDPRPSRRIAALTNTLLDLPTEFEDQLVLLTNLDRAGAVSALHGAGLTGRRRTHVLGAQEIAASLDREPELRAALPSVLGLRDLEPLIDADVRRRSAFHVEGAQALARVFWPTRAYERARAVLGRHRFVVLTGPPEMGKTAIARMLSLAQLTDGWEAHECTDPEQVWRAFDRGRAQVFVADDAFGSTEYRPDAAERWARGLGPLLAQLDARHWLIWTSRPAPLKAGLRAVQRERGSERFPSPAEVLVDAGDLDLPEKTLILFRHAKDRGADRVTCDLLRFAALSIVEHPYFTPERVRRLVTEALDELAGAARAGRDDLLRMVERELASPTDAMRASFRALEPEHRELLISLLDAPSGLIDERELAATVRRHHAGGLSRSPNELIDRLTDHFLRITPLGIGWVHPSWRDLVIEELGGDAPARRRFLAVCGIDGATLALSAEGGAAGERALPLLLDDGDWDTLGDRLYDLLEEVEDQNAARLLLALGGALGVAATKRQTGELRSLAICLLGATQRAWDQQRRALPVFVLEAWYELRASARADVAAPLLAPTWADLHPGSLLLAHPDRAELERTQEWLALARTLARYDAAALEQLAFFERDRDLLGRLIDSLTHVASDEELRPLPENVLADIEELVPDLATSAHSAIEIGRLVERFKTRRWWVPEDIAVPPSTEPVAAAPSDFRREDVERVLRDL